MRRLALLCAISALACFPLDTLAASAHATAQKAQVRRVVTRAYAALQHRRGDVVCALLTKRLRREVESIDPPEGRRRSCAHAVVAGLGGEFEAPTITRITIHGRRAHVVLASPGVGAGDIYLLRGPSGWKLDEI